MKIETLATIALTVLGLVTLMTSYERKISNDRMKKIYDRGLALGTGESTIQKPLPRIKTHEEVAAEIFGISIEEVTEEQRQAVKRARYWEMYSSNKPLHPRSNEISVLQDFSAAEVRGLAYIKSVEEKHDERLLER